MRDGAERLRGGRGGARGGRDDGRGGALRGGDGGRRLVDRGSALRDGSGRRWRGGRRDFGFGRNHRDGWWGHGHRFDRHRRFRRHNNIWIGLLGGLTYGNYFYNSYWYDPYWYNPYWYGGYGYYPSFYNRLWYDVVWYPSSTYVWYDDPWYGYGDTYYDGGYATYYGDWYGADTGITYTSPNSYVLGPVVSESYAPGEEPAPSGDAGQQYVDEAIAAFHAGNYAEALRLAQHATVEMPENGALYLFVAQAYFATGEYLAAAETLHQALQMLPEQDWELVVANHRDYYGNVGDFTKQLRALEAWLKEEPTAPFGYFWLGYTYGYLGYPEHAIGHLEQAVELSQTDAVAERMLEMFRSKVK